MIETEWTGLLEAKIGLYAYCLTITARDLLNTAFNTSHHRLHDGLIRYVAMREL